MIAAANQVRRLAFKIVLCVWLISLMCWAPLGILETKSIGTTDEHSQNYEKILYLQQPPTQKKEYETQTVHAGQREYLQTDPPASHTNKVDVRHQKKVLIQSQKSSESVHLRYSEVLMGKNDTHDGSDILITIKTARQNHRTRLPAILQTWFQLAREQTYFFTDGADVEVSRASGDHLVITGCSSGHTRQALSCKMNSEFDAFVTSNKKWWCHFDDDSYVNVPTLEKTLKKINSTQRWYLGKNSIRTPIDLSTKQWGNVRFRFATGGAGFCISRSLAEDMKPYAFKGKLAELSETIRLPDDVTVGFIVEVIVREKLKVMKHFHSHLEEMKLLKKPLDKQISLSYNFKRGNFVHVDNLLPRDSTRFLSIHCEIFPRFSSCNRFRRRKRALNSRTYEFSFF